MLDQKETVQHRAYKRRRHTVQEQTRGEEAKLFSRFTHVCADVAARRVGMQCRTTSVVDALAVDVSARDVAYIDCEEFIWSAIEHALDATRSRLVHDAYDHVCCAFESCVTSVSIRNEWTVVEIGIWFCAYEVDAVRAFLDDVRVREWTSCGCLAPPQSVVDYVSESLTARVSAFMYAGHASKIHAGVARDAFASDDAATQEIGRNALEYIIESSAPSNVMDTVSAFAEVVNERAPMCVCASCGIADPFVHYARDTTFALIKEVVKFTTENTQFLNRCRLLEVALGPETTILLSDLVERVELDGENFHVYYTRVNEMQDIVVDLCAHCAKFLLCGQIPRGSLSDGVWGLTSVHRGKLPRLNFVEAMILSHARPVAVIRRVSRRGGTHNKLVSNLISFDQSNVNLYEVMVNKSVPREIEPSVRIPSRDELLQQITVQFITPAAITPQVFGRYLTTMNVNPANLYAYIAVSKYIEACGAVASVDVTNELRVVQEVLEREYGTNHQSFHVELIQQAKHIVDDHAAVNVDDDVCLREDVDEIPDCHAVNVQNDLVIVEGGDVRSRFEGFNAVVPIEVFAEPLNVFGDENKAMAYYKRIFPHLFLFTRSARAACAVRDRTQMMITMFHYSRFYSKEWLFVAVAHWRAIEIFKQTRIVFDKSDEKFAELMRWFNARDYPAIVHAIRENVADGRALEFAKVLEKHGYYVASKIPFTNEKRRDTAKKLLAYEKFYGVPNFFITVAVDDIHSITMLRLALSVGSDVDAFPCDVDEFLKAFDRRQTTDAESEDIIVRRLGLPSQFIDIANDSPAAVARLFEVVCRAICERVFKVAMYEATDELPKTGALGPLLQAPFVVQTNERGSLHIHMLGFGASVDAQTLAAVAHDEALHAQIMALVDAFVDTNIPLDDAVRKKLCKKACTYSSNMRDVAIKPACDVTSTNVDEVFCDVFESRNSHKHTFTCHETPKGKEMCRLGYPRRHPLRTSVVELYEETDASRVVHEITERNCNCRSQHTVMSSDTFEASDARISCDADELHCVYDERALCFMHSAVSYTTNEIEESIERVLANDASDEVLNMWNEMSNEDKTEFVNKLKCLGAQFVPTNKALCVCTSSNTNVSYLGTVMQGLLSTYYVVRYITRAEWHAKQVGAILGRILEQYCTGERVSQAPDADTLTRQIIFLLQRAAFAQKTEISDTCAAAILLQVESDFLRQECLLLFIGSNTLFEFAHGADACEVCHLNAHVDEDEDDENVEDFRRSGRTTLFVHLSNPRRCLAFRYTFVEQYMARGAHLAHLSPYVYLACVEVCRKTQALFLFDASFTAAEYFGQRLRKKFVIPRLLQPPRWRSTYTATERDCFASYYLSIFRATTLPIDRDDFSFAVFIEWYSALKEDKFNAHARRVCEIFERYAFEKIDANTRHLIDSFRNADATRWHTASSMDISHASQLDANEVAVSSDMLASLLEQMNTDQEVLKRIEKNAMRQSFLRRLCDCVCASVGADDGVRAFFNINTFVWNSRAINQVVAHLPMIDEARELHRAYEHIMGTQFTMNAEQQTFVDTFIHEMTTLGARQRSKVWILSGAPGSGKSYATKALIQSCLRMRIGEPLVVSFQGKSATPLSGRTIHSAFGIKRSGEAVIRDVESLVQLRNWQNIKFLVIEEFSMVSPGLLRIMDQKLRVARNVDEFCGGLEVLALGDAMQIPPVRGRSIYEYMLGAFPTLRSYIFSSTMSSQMMIDIAYVRQYLNLEHVNSVWLQTQMRCRSTDIERQRAISMACDPYATSPLRLLMREVLRHRLTSDEMQEPRWQNAPVIVLDNTERHAINFRKLQAIASVRGLPIVRWRREIKRFTWVKNLPGVSDTTRFDVYFDQLYEEELCLWNYYVQDINVIITQNIQPFGKGISNGTEGTLRGLFWANHEENASAISSIQGAHAGEVITVPPPTALVIECTREQLRLHANAQWNDEDTLDSERILFPITATVAEHTTFTGETAARLGLKAADTMTLAYAPFYAITTHKVQGETRSAVILDLSNRRKSVKGEYNARLPTRTMSTMLVACTRVKSSDDMRFIGIDVDIAIQDIDKLEHDNFARLITAGFMHAQNYTWNLNAAQILAERHLKRIE